MFFPSITIKKKSYKFAFLFKGLVAVGERAQKRSGNFSAAMKDLSGENKAC